MKKYYFLTISFIFLFISSSAFATTYTITYLGGLVGGPQSEARGINNSGQVVGISWISSGNRAFLWEEGSPMQDIGTLVGGSASSAWGRNKGSSLL